MCKKCGECCKNYPFIELTAGEIKLLELATGLPFKMFTNSNGKKVAGYFLQFQKNGACFFLTDHNDGYSCRVYEARPGICKKYPSQAKEKKSCDANRAQFIAG
ncbi:MAG: YkgJ family cysteine cluster protein [Desulfobulbaceae bacterium]|nr:YkgJ family cysteine cluster protein [Desulfobulbaceae bacterium]